MRHVTVQPQNSQFPLLVLTGESEGPGGARGPPGPRASSPFPPRRLLPLRGPAADRDPRWEALARPRGQTQAHSGALRTGGEGRVFLLRGWVHQAPIGASVSLVTASVTNWRFPELPVFVRQGGASPGDPTLVAPAVLHAPTHGPTAGRRALPGTPRPRG